MFIRSLHVRHFRSIQHSELTNCGGLNVLIGKNNAGKSNILTAIEFLLGHLKGGRLAGEWNSSRRPSDEFTDRDITQRLQIGAEFNLDQEINEGLRTELLKENAPYERAIDQIRDQRIISFVIGGAVEEGVGYLFIERAAVGPLISDGPELSVSGITLLSVPPHLARELFVNEREAATYRADLAALERLESEGPGLDYFIRESSGSFLATRYLNNATPSLRRRVELLLKPGADTEQVLASLATIKEEIREKIQFIVQKELSGPLTAFAGEVKRPPQYMVWLMTKYGSMPAIHFHETKQPIGADEAAALLRLKVRRGGEERLSAVKNTVRALLGVTVDAFEPDEASAARRSPSRAARIAEMDINDFVVDANGAGIREALRIVLDLELKLPRLVLIEEPEVHLHPGLEQALHSYLQSKSAEVQLFVTTHSTNFVDAYLLQNIYVVSRDDDRKTVVESVISEDEAIKIPGELGLRLSTVFMYERLVFVEGQSDEEVLRQLASALGLDLTQGGVGFVQMRGIRNFSHFAAEGTLDLLSRRRIRMWFIADRDERGDEDVDRMMDRLGDRARLHVLSRRELENYLLDPAAVLSLIAEKQSGRTGNLPTLEEVRKSIEETAASLREEVIRLYVEREVLQPVFLQTRSTEGPAKSKISGAIRSLERRLADLQGIEDRTREEIDRKWKTQVNDLIPGALLLDKVLASWGFRYVKEVDSVRLAKYIRPESIASELSILLREITRKP